MLLQQLPHTFDIPPFADVGEFPDFIKARISLWHRSRQKMAVVLLTHLPNGPATVSEVGGVIAINPEKRRRAELFRGSLDVGGGEGRQECRNFAERRSRPKRVLAPPDLEQTK